MSAIVSQECQVLLITLKLTEKILVLPILFSIFNTTLIFPVSYFQCILEGLVEGR